MRKLSPRKCWSRLPETVSNAQTGSRMRRRSKLDRRLAVFCARPIQTNSERIRMAFLSGRVTFARYRVKAPGPGLFGPEHLKKLSVHAAGKQRMASADGIEIGWAAGDHILDTRFDLAKNIINESLLFALRVDSQKVPIDLQRAYYQIELEAFLGSDPTVKPSPRHKKAAKEAARTRLQLEAKDGRFLKRKLVPVLWDAKSNELLIGTTSPTAVNQLHSHFERTFGIGFNAVTAGWQAYRL